MPTDHTETQPQPNISTERQGDGDARRPSDTLDREEPEDRATPGGNEQEDVEDRLNVSQVKAEDYPADQRGGGTPVR